MNILVAPFLFNKYTDIFNKIKKDEIDLNILFQLLHILKLIEDSKLDQHTGSFEVGKLLKSIYIKHEMIIRIKKSTPLLLP